MPRTTLPRLLAVLTGAALLAGFVAQPALADPVPADVSGLSGQVGDHAAVLSWSSGAPKAIVRDVTGVAGTPTPTSGTGVTSTATSAKDGAFTNTSSHTYAVWAAAADGTTSTGAQTVTVPTVGPVATTLSLQTSRAFANYGTQYAIVGTLLRDGSPSAHQRVDLLARVGGTSTVTVARRLTTDGNGAVKAVLVSTRDIELQLSFAGDAFSAATKSAKKIVQMQPVLSGSFSQTVVVQPETTVFSGTVPAGLPKAAVRIQRKTASGFGTLTSVTPDSKGHWSYTYKPGGIGTFAYRALLPAGINYRTATSPTRTLEVDTRNLVKGDTGADVLSLKKRLLALHYSPGPLNTSFDSNLYHAVITFEKVERLPRNGTWTRTERVRMSHPHGITLRYKTTSGPSVDVDITRQVVVYSEAGVIKMIVDTSTGGEYRYTYTGGSDIAHTPRGNFKVQRKINGVRTSKLGYLYRPSYFTGGFAIHGEGYDVPSHPASHGCVRITDYNTDILYSKLVVGTPVHVFDE